MARTRASRITFQAGITSPLVRPGERWVTNQKPSSIHRKTIWHRDARVAAHLSPVPRSVKVGSIRPRVEHSALEISPFDGALSVIKRNKNNSYSFFIFFESFLKIRDAFS